MSLNQAITTATQALNRNADLYFAQKGIIDQHLSELEQRHAQKETQIDAVMAQWGIANDTTLEVGTGREFVSIQAAWNHIARSQLKGTVTIRVTDGVYEQSLIALGNQPYAAHIRIIGNEANPENCILRFVNDDKGKSHGVIVANCRGLTISGFKITSADRGNNHRGLLVHNNSHVLAAENSLVFDNCRVGLESSHASLVLAHGVQTTGCIRAAIIDNSSQADLKGFRAVGPGKDHSGGDHGGYGIQIQNGKVWAYGADIRDYPYGFSVSQNGFLWCYGSKAHNCKFGFIAHWGGMLWNHANTGQHPQGKVINCDYGFRTDNGGLLLAKGALADGCRHGFVADNAGHLHANESHAHNCTKHGYHAGCMALLDAWDTRANVSGNANDYNLAHATSGNYGAMIRRS